MITSFADKATEDIYNGKDSKDARKRLDKALWPVARRKLDMIDAASQVKDLSAPPGNRLEALKGDLAGYYNIRINDQHCIVFKFQTGAASEVRITDYH